MFKYKLTKHGEELVKSDLILSILWNSGFIQEFYTELKFREKKEKRNLTIKKL